MFSKSNLISTLVTAIWGYLAGWLLWGMLMDPILEEHNAATGIMKEMPDMVHLLIGCIISGFVFSSIYSKWANGNFGPSSGLSYGIWVGVLFGLGAGMIDMSVMNMLDFTGTMLNGATYIVFYAIMGLLAGLIYQKISPAD